MFLSWFGNLLKNVQRFDLIRYGDVTPKTLPGRMFGIIWVLVGAVVMSSFTATFINAMQTAVDGTKCKDIEDKEVSVNKRITITGSELIHLFELHSKNSNFYDELRP